MKKIIMKRAIVRDVPANYQPTVNKYLKSLLPTENIIGWFATKYNMATGWHIFTATEYDKAIFGSGVFRVYSEKTESSSIIKFNLKTGTYAFLNNEKYENENIIKFQRMSSYNRLFIEPTFKARKEFNVL